MKKFFSILMTVLSLSAYCQTLKTFNGTFNDGKLQNGTAVYTYYEDPNTHEYLKQGAFKYTFTGKGDYQGYDQTITGNFEKGLKNDEIHTRTRNIYIVEKARNTNEQKKKLQRLF